MSAPVKSFKSLLDSIARRIGKLKDDGTIDAYVSGDLTDQVNSAMKAAWQVFAWPDALVITEEDVITHPDVTGARYVPRQTATRTMTSVLKVWNKDPRQSTEAVSYVPTKKFSDGVYIYDANLSTVWVYYRPAAPEYSNTAWVTATAYVVGDLVLFTDGQCYRCVTAHTSVTFATDLTAVKWVVVPVLLCLFEAVKRGVISAWRRDQSSQPMTAKAYEELMRSDLENEIENIRNEED